jgi:hypothetical protein
MQAVQLVLVLLLLGKQAFGQGRLRKKDVFAFQSIFDLSVDIPTHPTQKDPQSLDFPAGPFALTRMKVASNFQQGTVAKARTGLS